MGPGWDLPEAYQGLISEAGWMLDCWPESCLFPRALTCLPAQRHACLHACLPVVAARWNCRRLRPRGVDWRPQPRLLQE